MGQKTYFTFEFLTEALLAIICIALLNPQNLSFQLKVWSMDLAINTANIISGLSSVNSMFLFLTLIIGTIFVFFLSSMVFVNKNIVK